MPQTRRRPVRRSSRLLRRIARWSEIADLSLACDALPGKSACSQVSRWNLILSGMSAPSMQLFDTRYFLFLFAYVGRSRPAR